MRYVGQGHEVNVPIPHGTLDQESIPSIEDSFAAVYRQLYGRVAPGNQIETVNWRVVVSAPRPELPLEALGTGRGRASGDAIKGTRPVYLPEARDYREAPVVDRYRLVVGDTIDGPAIVEERESTFLLGPSAQARVDDLLNLVIDLPAS
jgi:N-methylhydantoinase A